MTSKSLQMGPSQKTPFPTIFPKTKRPADGLDLSSQVAIITGANSGLGYHSAHHLLSLKLSHLIIAVRSLGKGEEAAAKLRTSFPSARIEVWELEMGSYESIQKFVQRTEVNLSRLDIVILNAGLSHMDFTLCKSTGHDDAVQVNYLSTFLLAILILQVQKKKRSTTSPPSRLTIVSSSLSALAKFPNREKRPLLASFDDIAIQPFDTMERYSVSKLLGQLFLVRLLKYLDPEETIVNLVEPGLTKGTGLFREASVVIGAAFWVFKALAGRTAEDAAWSYVDAVVIKGKESHGSYILDGNIHPFAEIVYAPEGGPVMDALWEETLDEFEFAGVREMLQPKPDNS